MLKEKYSYIFIGILSKASMHDWRHLIVVAAYEDSYQDIHARLEKTHKVCLPSLWVSERDNVSAVINADKKAYAMPF